MDHLQIKCPRCFKSGFWKTNDNRLKCKNCRYIFTPKPNLLNIPNEVLNEIVSEFILEHSTNIILERVNISRYKLLKILTLFRILMTKDIPDVFEGIVNPHTKFGSESISDTIKQPVIGILCREGKVYAKVLSNLQPADVKFFLKNKNEPINYSEDWQKYFGLAFKNSLYRLVPQKKHQIDALEGFWGYLKRKLTARGGIRKEKLPLYLGEYVWRYNYRKLTLKEQEKRLLNLVLQHWV